MVEISMAELSMLEIACRHLISGLPICHVSGNCQEILTFSRLGIVRKFCKLSGKFGIVGKCQGIVRKF